ncbi:MAG: PD-(D/E)XK nuclease family protein, partial [Myxococcota bacterium]
VPPWMGKDVRIGGGRALQPLLYALALETMFPDSKVVGGRLFYCTSRGGFQMRDVALDARGREAAGSFLRLVGKHLRRGFLPAAPSQGSCKWCDYAAVCGPHEERRTRRKAAGPLTELLRVRDER